MLVAAIAALGLVGCGSEPDDPCASGIRELTQLDKEHRETERDLLQAIANDRPVDRLTEREIDLRLEMERLEDRTLTACGYDSGRSRDPEGNEVACVAAVETWSVAADDLADAQRGWTDAVDGWDASPRDVRAAEENVRSADPDASLETTYSARADAYATLEVAGGPYRSPWVWSTCGEHGQDDACAKAIAAVEKWDDESRSAREQASERSASYWTTNDETAEVADFILRQAEEVSEHAC